MHNIVRHSLVAVLVTTAATAWAQTSSICTTIKVEGLTPATGFLYLSAYDSAANYFKKPIWRTRVKVTEATESVQVCGLQADEIAIMGYQDLNDNGKLDSNPLGIPNEPYGSSGTPAMFSAPTWESAKVKFVPETIINIKM
jgi:uncharacterized protein (DUF2141 family)